MSGAAVRALTSGESNGRLGARIPKPHDGESLHLWQLEGLWRVWSSGPRVGTRWMQPVDGPARELYDRLRTEPGCASPIIEEWSSGCAVIRCKDLRPVTTVGGAA